MKTKKWEGFKYPRWGGMGENTPFAIQSRKKEQDNGHDNKLKRLLRKVSICQIIKLSYKVPLQVMILLEGNPTHV